MAENGTPLEQTKMLGELETLDTESQYEKIIAGADVDWEVHNIRCNPPGQGDSNSHHHAYSASTISARGSQCNSVSSTDSVQSTDEWQATDHMFIRAHPRGSERLTRQSLPPVVNVETWR